MMGLTFGALDLLDDGFGGGYGFVTMGEDVDLGRPEPINTTVETFLQDGSKVVTLGHDNRTIVLRVAVVAADSLSLSEGTSALFLECSKRNALTITPEDGIGAPTVFEVWTTSMSPAPYMALDLDEKLTHRRIFRLELICAPFGRSESEVVDAALPAAGGADTQINACDSATGWTAPGLAVDTVRKVEGSASLTASPTGGTSTRLTGTNHYFVTASAEFELSGLSLNLSTTPYLSVKVDGLYSGPNVSVEMYVDGVLAPQLATNTLDGYWKQFWFRSTDTAVSKIKVRVTIGIDTISDDNLVTTSIPSDWKPRIDDLRRSGSFGVASATGRESLREVQVTGSARSDGSLVISHATAGLGDVLVYSTSALNVGGYSPELRRWRKSGSGTSTSGSSISGSLSRWDGATAEVYEMPADILPRGGFLLIGRLESVPTEVLQMTAEVVVGSTVVGSKVYTLKPKRIGTTLFYTLAAPTLPVVDVPAGSAALLRLSFVAVGASGGGSAGYFLDEMFLCALADDAALTVVACGATGTPAVGSANSRLQLTAANGSTPRPSIWMGVASNGTDSYQAGSKAGAWKVPTMTPPSVLAFVANTGGANPAVEWRHTPAWHTHAVA